MQGPIVGIKDANLIPVATSSVDGYVRDSVSLVVLAECQGSHRHDQLQNSPFDRTRCDDKGAQNQSCNSQKHFESLVNHATLIQLDYHRMAPDTCSNLAINELNMILA